MSAAACAEGNDSSIDWAVTVHGVRAVLGWSWMVVRRAQPDRRGPDDPVVIDARWDDRRVLERHRPGRPRVLI